MTGRFSAALGRRLLAEFLGTGLLVAVVVGSGTMAAGLSADVGLRLLANTLATVLGLAVLIVVFGPVSGAHFNPVVSAVAWWAHRRDGSGPTGSELGGYVAVQSVGGIAGAVLANAMFGLPAAQISTTVRSGGHLWLSEVIATAGLILVIHALVRTERANLAPVAVAGWIGAAYWFTASTSFANPAVTVGRVFSDTFAGISPASAPGFVIAQIIGGALGLAAADVLYSAPCEEPT